MPPPTQETNPKYGTIAQLKSFVSRAHELQMEVWLDWVPNHTATNADWVTTHPEYYATSGGKRFTPITIAMYGSSTITIPTWLMP